MQLYVPDEAARTYRLQVWQPPGARVAMATRQAVLAAAVTEQGKKRSQISAREPSFF